MIPWVDEQCRADKPKLSGDRCRCGACGEAFNSTYAFDKHRQGPYTDRRCLTPLAMADKGFEKNAAGFWISGRKKPFVRRAA